MASVLPPYVSYDTKDQLLRARFRGPFKGLDTTASLSNMDYLALRIADNADIEDNGALIKRRGYVPLLDSAWGSLKIRYATEFTTSSISQIILWGQGATANSSKLGKLSSGSFASVTDLSTGLPNTRPSIFQFADNLFFYNGTAAKRYDGTNLVQVGITAPTNAPTLASNTNGDLIVGASYYVAYTYYNSVTGAESSPSPLSAALTIAASPNDGITVTYTDGSSTTADKVRFYRTVANGAILFLDKEVALGSSSTTLIQADAGLGKELVLDNSRYTIFDEPKYAWVSENRVVATGLANNVNRAILSAVYSDGPKPESFPANKFVDCQSSRGSADNNLGGGMAGDTTIILKKNSVGRIEKIGVDTTILSEDPVVFSYREISRAVTGISHFAAANVFNEYIWLGIDNIYATDGVSLRSIADPIRQTLLGFDFTRSDKFSAFNDIPNKRLLFSVFSDPLNSEPDYVLVGNYSDYPEFKWTIYRPGEDEVTHPGISAGCFFEVRDFDTTPKVVFGNAWADGQLYRMNYGTNDNGSPIYFRVRFAPINYGLDEEEKLFIKDAVKAIGTGASYNLTCKSFYNYSGTEKELELVNIGTEFDVWGGFNWGFGTWGANSTRNVNHNAHTKAFVKQFHIENVELDEPVTIYSYEMMARPTAYRG